MALRNFNRVVVDISLLFIPSSNLGINTPSPHPPPPSPEFFLLQPFLLFSILHARILRSLPPPSLPALLVIYFPLLIPDSGG